MARNAVQLKKWLSEAEFDRLYGTEGDADQVALAEWVFLPGLRRGFVRSGQDARVVSMHRVPSSDLLRCVVPSEATSVTFTKPRITAADKEGLPIFVGHTTTSRDNSPSEFPYFP